MKRSHFLVLIFILLLGLFFRTYQAVERFEFAHDGDLYSWIVKDIVINGHLRLLGQQTSAPGIFIGPLFYYLLVPFFLLSNMDPIGAIIPITIIGLLTILSHYFVFSKLFNVKVGLIAAFLYAALLSPVGSDRWIVPTNLTSLWAIWYFYTIIQLVRGKFFVLPILGILIGLIWHIHIALAPTLSAVPLAILLSSKFPNFLQLTKFSIALIFTSLPLIIFEFKNNFPQLTSLLQIFIASREGAEGFYKFQLVLGMVIKNINGLFFAPQSPQITNNIIFVLIVLLSAMWLVKQKILSLKMLTPLYVWLLGVILFFAISSSPISEYYFSNIEVIFLAIGSLLLFSIFKSSALGKGVVIGLLGIVLIKNIYFIIALDYYNKGYIERKKVVEYIVNDAKHQGFPCFSINYITSPGENVGFRYFFFLKNAHIAVAGRGSPVYSIVIPDEYALKEVEVKFGHIGIITPKETLSKEFMIEACSGANTNLTDPMSGYVE